MVSAWVENGTPSGVGLMNIPGALLAPDFACAFTH